MAAMPSLFHLAVVLSLALLALAAASPLPSGASSAAASPRPPRGPTFAAQFLSAMNGARAKVGVPPLSWNATIALRCREYTAWLRANAGCGLGQLGAVPGARRDSLTYFLGPGHPVAPADVVSFWLTEEEFYDRATNTCAAGEVCGDYTQVVARLSRQVGCAVVACPKRKSLVACGYYPPAKHGERPY